MAKHFKLNGSGVIEFAGANNPGWVSNLSITNATTTNADDSIKITSFDGTALSTDNPGYVTISNSSGELDSYEVTADVTIDLTGAHYGNGTKGNLTDAILRVFAINDNDASVIWSVELVGGRPTMLNTNTSTTGTSVTDSEDGLVNSALTGGTWMQQEFFWFRANFTDTGGAAEDIWQVQSGVGDLNHGSALGIWQPWNPTFTGFSVDPAPGSTIWTQFGLTAVLAYTVGSVGTSNGTGFTIEAPVKAKVGGVRTALGFIRDNGSNSADGGLVTTTGVGDATLSLAPSSASFSGWTASSTKDAAFTLSFPIKE